MARKKASSEGDSAAATSGAFQVDTAPAEDLSLLDQDARALVDAAARLTEAEDGEALGQALAHNLRVWIAIKTIVNGEGNPLPSEIRHNLDRLAAYVVRTTLGDAGQRISEASIESLARINLHIADGLMRSQRNRLIRDRAYQIWEDQGRPEGREVENWLQAEQEILALLATD